MGIVAPDLLDELKLASNARINTQKVNTSLLVVRAKIENGLEPFPIFQIVQNVQVK